MSENVASVDLDALVRRLDELEREQHRLQETLHTVEQNRDEYRALYQQMLERCRKLERGLIGQKAERLPAHESQLSLAVLASVLGERARIASSFVDGNLSATPTRLARRLD